MKPRLAIVVSHPIQYQASWFRALASAVDLTVFFCHRQDGQGQADAGFGVTFEWDVPLLDGYRHEWLTNVSAHPNVSAFNGCDTPGIHAALAQGKFDACIVSGWYLRSYLQAIYACRRLRIPVFLRGDSHLGTKRSGLRSLVKYVPYRWLLRSVDGHLYVGRANREYLQHYGVPSERLQFVPHSVDNAFFREASTQARANGTADTLRHSIGVSGETVVVASIGKLLPGKRVSDLIKALAAARNRGFPVHGLIIGSGPGQADLERLAGETAAPVTFLGFRNQTELPACLAASDLFAMPSESETWGLAVNEAMACGLPAVVSSAVGCGRDLVVEGRTGWTFPTADVAALTSVLGVATQSLLTHRSALSQAIAERIDRYSLDVAVDGTLKAINGAWRRRPEHRAESLVVR
jgi:glycosyltransferase involved in cell wall biosynthesis